MARSPVRVACVVATVLVALGAAGAGATSQPRSAHRAGSSGQTAETASGTLTISWSGAPARGCAAAGLCGVSGSLQIVSTGGVGESSSPATSALSVELQDSQAAARVIQRDAGGAIEDTCADLVPVDLQISSAGRGGGARALVQGAQPPSSGRCAGPAGSDLAGLMLPARRIATGYDLSGTETLGAGPFTVSVASTLRVKVTRSPAAGPFPGGLGASSTSSSAGVPAARPAFVEQASYDYRLIGVAGSLTAGLRGLADPLCRPLGACGTSGRLTVSLTGRGTVTFTGGRQVARRVGAAAALADLRAGRIAIYDTLGGLPLREALSETLVTPNGPCTDRLTQPMSLIPSGFRRGVERVLFGPGPESSLGFPATADPLRTRCPGPSLQDVAGGGSLAHATIASGRLGARRIEIALRSAGSFLGSSYAGRRAGALVLRLALVRARGGTQRVTVPPIFPAGGGSSSSAFAYGVGTGGPALQQSIPVSASGQLTVDFHGDAAAGCAALGVCGYSGWESFTPTPRQTLTLLGSRSDGRLGWSIGLTPEGLAGVPGTATTSAAVGLAGQQPAGAQQCLDATPTAGQLQLPARGGTVAFSLAGALPGVLDDRCAGPRFSAIASLIPVPRLAVNRVRRGDVSVTLEASGPFAADGFAGTVRSTVVLRLGRAGRTGTLSPEPSGRHRGWRSYRQLSIAYRARLSGTVLERFAGVADQSACAVLGSCGDGGTRTYTAQARTVPAHLTLYEPAARPRSWLLAALGRGDDRHLRAVTGFGDVTASGVAAVETQLSQGCRASSSAAIVGPFVLIAVSRGQLQASVPPFPGSAPTDVCPGPAPGLFGIGSRRLPATALRGRTISLRLSAGGPFADDGYSGSARPDLTLTLTRVGWRTSIVREPPGVTP